MKAQILAGSLGRASRRSEHTLGGAGYLHICALGTPKLAGTQAETMRTAFATMAPAAAVILSR